MHTAYRYIYYYLIEHAVFASFFFLIRNKIDFFNQIVTRSARSNFKMLFWFKGWPFFYKHTNKYEVAVPKILLNYNCVYWNFGKWNSKYRLSQCTRNILGMCSNQSSTRRRSYCTRLHQFFFIREPIHFSEQISRKKKQNVQKKSF